jgi:nicotinamide-nucleotide amidase
MLPKSCVPTTNKFGTAPGMWFERQDSVLVSLPGVPFEMKALMSNEVIPLVAKRWTLPNVVHKSITVGGIAEAMLAEKLSVWESELPEYIKLAYLPSPGIIRLRMSVYESDNAKDEQIIVHANKLKSIIPEHLISLNGLSLSEVIGKLLLEKQWNISTAESCTGGAIAAEITSVSGASDYFKGSVVAYHNSIKQNLLNVPSEYIENYGAVSKQVAESMANGVNKLLNTEISVAVTGVAGPTGGTTDKPVGTVWIATSIEGKISSKKYQFGNSRDINIQRTVNAALLNLIIELRRKN